MYAILHENIWFTCTYVFHVGLKGASDLLELGLQMVVNHQVGAGNQTWSQGQ